MPMLLARNALAPLVEWHHLMMASERTRIQACSHLGSRVVLALPSWLGCAIMFVPFVSGLLKLADLSSFQAVLQTWTVFPDAVLNAAMFVVPLTELTIGLVWYLGLSRRRALQAWAFCLVLFSMALGVQVFWGKPPDCGCFGVADRYFTSLGGVPWLLFRNTVLFILTIGCLYWLRAGAARVPPDSR
ncbi:MAG: MauE/DoxX family redox-associated membrane protein [Planctomycetota bacterium]|nr:MauE/DoxX family redox-associated membrane protein [Planctomycetota bacterium]